MKCSQSLLDAIQEVARDNDEYLGEAFQFFGNAWATVNMLPNDIELIKVGSELKDYVHSKIPLKTGHSSCRLFPRPWTRRRYSRQYCLFLPVQPVRDSPMW